MRMFLDRFSTKLILGVLGLVLFFVPLVTNKNATEYSEWPKALFLFGGAFVIAALWAVKAVAGRELSFKTTRVFYILFGLLAWYFLSSLASVARFTSFFGEPGVTRMPFFVLASLVLIIFSIFQVADSLRERGLLTAAVFGGYGLGVLQLLVFVTPLRNYFPSVALFPALYSQVFDSVMLLPALVLLGATFLCVARRGFVTRVLGAALFGIGAITLFVFGGSVATAVAVIGLLVLAGLRYLYVNEVAPIFSWVFVGAAIFLSISFWVPTRAIFRVGFPAQVSLDMPASYSIFKSTVTQSTKVFLFGSGPSTFAHDFSLFRPISLNYTTAWQSRFSASGSALMEMGGAAGVLSVFALLAIVAWLSVRVFKKLYHARNAVQFDKLLEVQPEKTMLVGLVLALMASTFALAVSGGGIVTWVGWLFVIVLIEQFLQDCELPKRTTIAFTTTHRRAGVFGVVGLVGAGIAGLVALTFYRIDLADTLFVASRNADANTKLVLLTRALDLNPERVVLYNALSQANLALGRGMSYEVGASGNRYLIEAIQIAERATTVASKNILAWEQLVAVYLEAAPKTSEAASWVLTAAKRAEALEPMSPIWPVMLGDTLAALGNTDEAIAEYIKAIKLKKDWNAPYVKLASVFGSAGKNDEALAVLNEGLPTSLDDPDYLILFGATYFNRNKTGDAEAAIQLFNAALELQPNNKQALFALAAAQEHLKDYSAALAIYQRLLALSPSDVTVLKRLAAIRGKLRGGR